MSDIAVLAAGAVSALGLGTDAFAVTRVDAPAPCVLGRDALLSAAGLQKPFSGRAPLDLGLNSAPNADRAADLLQSALEQVISSLDEQAPDWRKQRIGVAMGTSSGGMLIAEQFFEARAKGQDLRALAQGATYFAPFETALTNTGLSGSFLEKRAHILAACSASTIAIGLGMRWLERDACDWVLAGGYDALSVFVASGFEVLRATTASRPRPFRMGRDGMSLGEGAGVLAMVRADRALNACPPLFYLAGFGASTDAVHITAPDRTGAGLARAAGAALKDSGFNADCIDVVSAHATATPFNDAMESKAIQRVCGDHRPVVHPFKAQIGHTLGAAGVLETLAAADALRAQVAPAAAGEGEPDPDAPALLLNRAESRPLRAALKLSAAFGGANASLVLSASQRGRAQAPIRPVYLHACAMHGAIDVDSLSQATGAHRDRLSRLDTLCRLGLSAVAELAQKTGRPRLEGAGIVAGHALATLETNEAFAARLRTRGPTGAEPRVFPATSPNAVAGECAIVYQLTGPSFAVASGLQGGIEALECAAELIAAGNIDRMVVLAADDIGPAGRDLLEAAGWGHDRLERGACALFLDSAEEGALAPIPLDIQTADLCSAAGHLALKAWTQSAASLSI